MNILIISPLLPIKNKSHGNIFVYQQAKKLAERGHKVWAIVAHTKTRNEGNLRIIARPKSTPSMAYQAMAAFAKFPSKSLDLLHVVGLKRAIGYLSLVEIADRIIKENNIDIVDGQFIGTGGIVAYFLEKPYIIMEHGIFRESIIKGEMPEKERELSKKSMKIAKAVIVPSRYLADYIEQFTKKEVRVLPNGVDNTVFKPQKRCLFNKPTFLSVGHLTKDKNHMDLLKAYNVIIDKGHDADLVIIGWGNELKNLEKYLTEKKIAERVRFIEYMENKDLPEYYSSAVAFVLPTLSEAFGIVFIEAMSCGCPVISNRICAVPEVVGDGGILVEPGNIKQLAEAMEMILTDKLLRTRLNGNALRQAKIYNIEKRIDMLEKMYHSAI